MPAVAAASAAVHGASALAQLPCAILAGVVVAASRCRKGAAAWHTEAGSTGEREQGVGRRRSRSWASGYGSGREQGQGQARERAHAVPASRCPDTASGPAAGAGEHCSI